jgi:ribonuclease BN (tRNA processing enzyme)
VLSHYHLDHVIGLTWLPKVWNSELRIFAPSEPLVGVRAEYALKRLTGAPLFALPLEEYPFPITIVPVSTEAPIEIDDITVRVLRQEHAGGSIGFRVDDCFAYITDTDPGDRHVPFLANVGLALIDAFYDTTEYRIVRGDTDGKLDHGSNLGAALTAKEAGVQKLGLIHINPSYTAQRCETMLEESRSVVPSTMLPADGVPISV